MRLKTTKYKSKIMFSVIPIKRPINQTVFPISPSFHCNNNHIYYKDHNTSSDQGNIYYDKEEGSWGIIMIMTSTITTISRQRPWHSIRGHFYRWFFSTAVGEKSFERLIGLFWPVSSIIIRLKIL